MQESIVFLLRVQCRRIESSRSLSHLLMSFLFSVYNEIRTTMSGERLNALSLMAIESNSPQSLILSLLLTGSHP